MFSICCFFREVDEGRKGYVTIDQLNIHLKSRSVPDSDFFASVADAEGRINMGSAKHLFYQKYMSNFISEYLQRKNLEDEANDSMKRLKIVAQLNSFDNISALISTVFSYKILQHLFFEIRLTEILYIRGRGGESLLHVAVGCGNISAIRLLVSIGFSFYDNDSLGNTPVHYIGLWSYNVTEVTKTLLEFGVDFSHLNINNETVAHHLPMYINSESLYHDWVKIIINSGFGRIFTIKDKAFLRTPLHCVVEYFDIQEETLEAILTVEGVDINAMDARGRTVVSWACLCGRNEETISLIGRYGGDWRFNTWDGTTAVHYAVYGGNINALKYLMTLGAEPMGRTSDGRTPLHNISNSPYHQVTFVSI